MKKFTVYFKAVGYGHITINAENEADARARAMEDGEPELGEWEVDYLTDVEESDDT